MTFEDMSKVLIYYHLQEFSSGAELLQNLEEDEFAKMLVGPKGGLKKSTFHDYLNERGLEQFQQLFEGLVEDCESKLPAEFEHLGELVSVDGSFIDSVLSMQWADYRDGSKKAKAHLGYNVNRGIPQKVFLTDGKADERQFGDKLVSPGQTGIYDRYYQCHRNFDEWQSQGIHFVCRLKIKTRVEISKVNDVPQGGIIISDVVGLLGCKNVNQTEKQVRVVTYQVDDVTYKVATDRFDLSAEDVAKIYKLRWSVESFFKWWKQHLGVYHLISRSRNGLKVQVLAGLITYLLLKIYCREQFDEDVSIKRVRSLRAAIKNDLVESMVEVKNFLRKRRNKMKSKKKRMKLKSFAKT